MTEYSDAALLRGNFAHMAADLRAGSRSVPSVQDWEKVACDNGAEEAAQEIAKHIFALQESVDEKAERLEVTAFSAMGPMKVLALVPGEGDILRLDGVLDNGQPVAQALHKSQLSLTFTKVPLGEKEDDDGLQIGFLIFDDLEKRRKERDKLIRSLSLKTSRTIKPDTGEPSAPKSKRNKPVKKKT